jgi:hypothetical protein
MTLEDYYELVEAVISNFGVNPVESRGDRSGNWVLQKGNTLVWIDVFNLKIEDSEYPHFQVCSPIFKIPENEQTKNNLFEEMLRINDTLFGVAFSIYENWTYVKVIRESAGLNEQEAMALILKVGNFADRYKAELSDKFSL